MFNQNNLIAGIFCVDFKMNFMFPTIFSAVLFTIRSYVYQNILNSVGQNMLIIDPNQGWNWKARRFPKWVIKKGQSWADGMSNERVSGGLHPHEYVYD